MTSRVSLTLCALMTGMCFFGRASAQSSPGSYTIDGARSTIQLGGHPPAAIAGDVELCRLSCLDNECEGLICGLHLHTADPIELGWGTSYESLSMIGVYPPAQPIRVEQSDEGSGILEIEMDPGSIRVLWNGIGLSAFGTRLSERGMSGRMRNTELFDATVNRETKLLILDGTLRSRNLLQSDWVLHIEGVTTNFPPTAAVEVQEAERSCRNGIPLLRVTLEDTSSDFDGEVVEREWLTSDHASGSLVGSQDLHFEGAGNHWVFITVHDDHGLGGYRKLDFALDEQSCTSRPTVRDEHDQHVGCSTSPVSKHSGGAAACLLLAVIVWRKRSHLLVWLLGVLMLTVSACGTSPSESVPVSPPSMDASDGPALEPHDPRSVTPEDIGDTGRNDVLPDVLPDADVDPTLPVIAAVIYTIPAEDAWCLIAASPGYGCEPVLDPELEVAPQDWVLGAGCLVPPDFWTAGDRRHYDPAQGTSLVLYLTSEADSPIYPTAGVVEVLMANSDSVVGTISLESEHAPIGRFAFVAEVCASPSSP